MCVALPLGIAAAPAQAQAPAQQQASAQPPAEAAERYGPFVYFPSAPNLLIYHTGVGANDMLNLKKALREHPSIATLILQNNGGGLVHIGLVVAEEVYERGLNTYIPKDSYCASACAFVYFAGRQRLAEGRLGVHQISAPEMTGEQAQFGVSDIVATLPKYGVSADVLGIMFSTPSKDMYFFSPQEIAKYGINRTGQTQVAQNSPPPRGTGGGQGGQANAPAATPAPAPAQAQTPAPAPVQTAHGGAAPVANPYMKKETAPAAISDEQKAVNAAALMIQAGSGTNEESMNFTREFYADTVDYFKKTRPKSEILADKEAYFARWPIRRFVVDQSTLKAQCKDQLCKVVGIYDYKVSSPARGKTATGTSNFTYVLDLRNRYRIVMEDSEVISR
ncbi:hypothetical protein [Achromobacter sp. Bel]|uniref:COG3904 family protein n=1 Tax=Achromobacter sp. Bel TaxID=2727415 RepID=UPI00145F3EC7|nr:hypothetical protein [Achromobacter sp. Bel]NMK46887.1 hypothetical protein [Achromobacter sp. Bel]